MATARTNHRQKQLDWNYSQTVTVNTDDERPANEITFFTNTGHAC